MKNPDSELGKDICMQIAAAKPEYLDEANVPKEVVDKETEIMKAQVINEGKPENIADKIVQGKLKKFYSEVCLLDQEFVKDSDIKVRKLLENKNNDVTEFVRFEKGEGIEKKEENFAEEVMKQIK